MKIPIFECPDEEINSAWKFRWETYHKHIKHAPEGWIITEFLQDVPWAGPRNTISCAAAIHIYEGRWLGRTYISDYLRFWLRGPGDAHSYSFAIADAMQAYCQATDDWELAIDLLPELKENHAKWEEYRMDSDGLFWQLDDRDGMEYSVSGAGNRLTINSYMCANARALSSLCKKAGDKDGHELYKKKAEQLQALIHEVLWDDSVGFFKTRSLPNHAEYNYNHYKTNEYVGGYNERGLSDAMEITGYLPWRFSLAHNKHNIAWQYLMDTEIFNAPYGLTTTDMRHPKFMLDNPHECLWNGAIWPFSSSYTIAAMIRLLNEYEQDIITISDLMTQVKKYAASMWITQKNGAKERWIDENMDPFTGRWLARDKRFSSGDMTERGEAYNHSLFCDLIITGLCGLNAFEKVTVSPLCDWDYFSLTGLQFRGTCLDIIYDKDGSKYHKESGLSVYIGGTLTAHSEKLEALNVDI